MVEEIRTANVFVVFCKDNAWRFAVEYPDQDESFMNPEAFATMAEASDAASTWLEQHAAAKN